MDPVTIEAKTADGINWEAAEKLANGEPGAGASGEPGAQEHTRPTPGQEVAGMLQALAMVIRPALPSVAAIYTPETCAAIGAAIDPVCAKYGWLQGGFQFGPELQAVVVVVPIALATAEAVKLDVARLKAAKAAKEAEAAAAKPKPAEGVPADG